ncbi:hypothetical protein RBG61_04970 [Paludicola sp. MB14-C6]|uniref:hypothetical protein n=1 Tax=Paludihabitans sp. MB14-C6 TaxID=3070656 RepID=UPI0027DAE362|nr:hypothetical protein [Paludicola sp. MB14-C6]WMJ24025.1 hypothetical protein RBG61_04970 [Paludicola sp. MB14-C6]
MFKNIEVAIATSRVPYAAIQKNEVAIITRHCTKMVEITSKRYANEESMRILAI